MCALYPSAGEMAVQAEVVVDVGVDRSYWRIVARCTPSLACALIAAGLLSGGFVMRWEGASNLPEVDAGLP
jgi:hypothetical protein